MKVPIEAGSNGQMIELHNPIWHAVEMEMKA